MKVISFIFLFSVCVLAQIKPLLFTPNVVVLDTTNNYYVSTTGTDGAAGTILDPWSIAKADTFFNYENKDSVFFIYSVTPFDTTFTINSGVDGVTYCSYSLTNRAKIYGADVISNWVLLASPSITTDTFYLAESGDDARIADGTYVNQTEPDSSINFIGQYSSSYDKAFLRFRGLTAVQDTINTAYIEFKSRSDYSESFLVNIKADTTRTPDTLVYMYGEEPNFDFNRRWDTTSTTAMVTYDPTAWETGEWYGVDVKDIVQEVVNLRGVDDVPITDLAFLFRDSTAEVAQYQYRQWNSFEADDSASMLIIEWSTGSQVVTYTADISSEVYAVFFNGALGNEVTDASLVLAQRDWYCDDTDSLVICFETANDTVNVEAVLRDGITVSDSAVIAGFDIQKTRYGVTRGGNVDTQIGQSYFENNVYGIYDYGTETRMGYYRNNIFIDNQVNLQIDAKDTAKIYNNVFINNSTDSTDNNIYVTNTKVKFKNNIIYTANTKLGYIDNASNISSLDYNAYYYYKEVAGKYFQIGLARYDSLSVYVGATAFEDSSFDVYSYEVYPYDDLYFENLAGEDFRLRNDTIVSPALNKGVDVGLTKDYIGNSIPDVTDSRVDMGAYEQDLTDDPPLAPDLNLSLVDDSTKLEIDTDELDIDSVVIYVNGIATDTVDYMPSVYHHPTASTVKGAPSITSTGSSNVGVTTATINFWLTPNNNTTVYRVRLWIDPTPIDSTTYYGDTLIFIPQTTTYYVRLIDDAGQLGYQSGEETLTYDDMKQISINLTGLSTDTTYTYDVTALNDYGYANSTDKTFRTAVGNPVEATWYIVNYEYDNTVEDDTLTITELNTASISAGDTVGFFCDTTYTLTSTLTIPQGGAVGNRTYYRSIGEGAKPILTTLYRIPGTATASNWDSISENIWKMSNVDGIQTSTSNVNRLFIDANGTDMGGKAACTGVGLDKCYDELGNWAGLDSTNNWLIKYNSTSIYVYNTQNPSVWATQMYVTNNWELKQYTIELNDKDYVTLNGLDIQAGYMTIYGVDSDSLIIENCNIGRNADYYGILLRNCQNGILRNDTLDANWKVNFTYDAETYIDLDGSDAFKIEGGSNWKIHDNYFTNWFHAGVYFGGRDDYDGDTRTYHAVTTNNEVYDNRFTNDNMYMRAFGTSVEVFWTSTIKSAIGLCSNNRFYRNRCDNLTARSQIGGDSNYVYYNVFDSCLSQPYGRPDIANMFSIEASGYKEGSVNSASEHNFIFNNTFYYADREIYQYGEGNDFFNNLFVNCGQWYDGRAFELSDGYRLTFKNNLVFGNSRTTDDFMFSYYRVDNTLAQFESDKGDGQLNVISDNIQYEGVLGDLININFTLPEGSSARTNKGIDISTYVPAGFTTDIDGNTIDKENPNIGCVDN